MIKNDKSTKEIIYYTVPAHPLVRPLFSITLYDRFNDFIDDPLFTQYR